MIWLPTAWIRWVLPRPTPPCRKSGLYDLPGLSATWFAGRARELVGLAGHEALERQRRVQPRALRRAGLAGIERRDHAVVRRETDDRCVVVVRPRAA